MAKMVSIKNKGPVELILGDIHVDDPASPGNKLIQQGQCIKPGGTSKPMPGSIFKFYDVPAVAAKVADGELELLVDGEPAGKSAQAPAPAPKNVTEALAQQAAAQGPTASAESQEQASLEELLNPKPA